MTKYEFFVAAHFFEQNNELHLREISVIRNEEVRYHFVIKNPDNDMNCLKTMDRWKYFEQEMEEHGIYWSDGDYDVESVKQFLQTFLVEGTFYTYDYDTLDFLQTTIKVKGYCEVLGYTWTQEWNEIRMNYLWTFDYVCDLHDLTSRFNTIGELCCTMARAQGILLLKTIYNMDPKNYIKD